MNSFFFAFTKVTDIPNERAEPNLSTHDGLADLVVPGCDIHRIHIIAINQWVEFSGWCGLQVVRRPSQEKGDLLAFMEFLQIEDGLGVETHAGKGLWNNKKSPVESRFRGSWPSSSPRKEPSSLKNPNTVL